MRRPDRRPRHSADGPSGAAQIIAPAERGIVLSMVRFGLKDGQKSQSTSTANSRIVAELFSVKRGLIQEVHAVLFNVPDTLPPHRPADHGPGRGGAGW
jgi:hypothetical protein